MTPEQLAVERDALLQGGRTLEEVERMQATAHPSHWCRVETRLAEEALLAANDRGARLNRARDDMALLLGRELATSPRGPARWTQMRDSLTSEVVLRLEVLVVSPPNGTSGGLP